VRKFSTRNGSNATRARRPDEAGATAEGAVPNRVLGSSQRSCRYVRSAAKGARVRDCCPKACTPWRREASPGSPRWKLGTPLAHGTYFVPGRRPVGGRELGLWTSTLHQQLSLAAMGHAWDTGRDREQCGGCGDPSTGGASGPRILLQANSAARREGRGSGARGRCGSF
jgi:hypothetical protein